MYALLLKLILANHEKAGVKVSHRKVAWIVCRFVARFLQLIMAAVVAGLYGIRIHHEHSAGQEPAEQWVYALVVAGLSGLTALVFLVPFVKSQFLFAWDAFLFILWVAVFGVFGQLYIHRSTSDSYEGTDTTRMKAAVWIDFINMILWFCTGTAGLIKFFLAKKGSSDEKSSKSEV